MTQQLLVFKNNLPNLTVLKVFSQDFEQLKPKLQQKIKQAPMMFIGMQLVIDLSAFDRETLTLNVSALLDFLQGESINPVAFISDSKAMREDLVKTGLGVLPVLQGKAERSTPAVKSQTDAGSRAEKTASSQKTTPTVATTTEQEEPRKTFDETTTSAASQQQSAGKNKIIRHPIRTGQRIYAQGDLTVVGAVNPGAEVIAEGNIHIYGKLRGRAIAGAQGDESAVIFCQSLDAELVSIAGNYKQLEEIDAHYRHQCVQISLESEKISFSSL